MTINTDKKSLITYIIISAIFLAILSGIYTFYSNKLEDSEQNLKTVTGQLKEVELKNGQLLAYRDLYIATTAELESIVDMNKKEIKELQKELDSKIAYISKIESQIKVEYIETVRDSIIYVQKEDSTISHAVSTFRYKDNWMSLVGKNKFTFEDNFKYSTTIESLNMNVPLTVGLTDDYQIFVKTPNPYVSFSEIKGAVIDGSILKPKKKRFNWGLQLGLGTMYDIIDKDVSIGPYGGIGIEFNF